MFRSSNFDKLLDKATSNLRLEPDWTAIIELCDLIRQNDCQPKYALTAIKKKLTNTNPHVAMFGLQVLESCVKNCGTPIHDEIATKQFMEQLKELVKGSSNENFKNKVLELIQAWAYAFRNCPKYRAVQDTVNIMKTEGYKFPVLKESDAMFSADTAPEWENGVCCHRCRVPFSVMQRKHHCRACGQVFCHQCSSKTSTLPKFGIEKEVRVCEACYEKVNKPTSGTSKTDGDLPSEYTSSSLAQQTQTPAKKTEEELKEEEELQLALALSKSEAEEKEKRKNKNSKSLVKVKQFSPPPAENPPSGEEDLDPELSRYLNRSYWEQRQQLSERQDMPNSVADDGGVPSAPTTPVSQSKGQQENGETGEIEDFMGALRSQVEIFVNRMKSNSSRGRSIANDSSVQTLFMNITAMHSRLLKYIQEQDDRRLYYEGLQDKLAQVKDARAALDALRDEHREKLRRQAEEAERLRQLQMAQKLEIMRKKKQEYLQYQRQVALQRMQEQEREMQLRQEQHKQQYMVGQIPYGVAPQHFIPPGIGQPQGYHPPNLHNSPGHGPYPQPMIPPGAGPHPSFPQHGPPNPTSIPGTMNGSNTYEYPMYSVAGLANNSQGPLPPGPQQMQGAPGHPMMPGPRPLQGQNAMITVGQTLPGPTQSIAMAQNNQPLPVSQQMPIVHPMPGSQPMLVGQPLPHGQPIPGAVQNITHGQPLSGTAHPIAGQAVASQNMPAQVAPHFPGIANHQEVPPQLSHQIQPDGGQQPSGQQTAELISFD
ncbi:hepatocyte growth factor-regulated tyrosine kinase substrate isoform X2 [Ischnura elegans]|uniref:hepatocyte growth factor-regulated tyrosine kinase substrate isoform X2 n=1 Tax=Ischnura elegans TaxID=197161 RepID=UPI001ED8BA31|nr:hepatocyte growth factor-regulated tyrosine kinase substrate isoform X2 [Ischnura elegans]